MELEETRSAGAEESVGVNTTAETETATMAGATGGETAASGEVATAESESDNYQPASQPLPTNLNAEAPQNAGAVATSAGLSASVGKKGENKEADVKQVQTLLNKNGAQVAADGKMGPKTIKAIEAFQQSKLGFKDGLVEPDKATWKALNGESVSSEGGKEAGAQGKAEQGQNIDPKSISPKPTPEQKQQDKSKGQDKGGNANAPTNGKLIYEDIAVKKHGDKFIAKVKEIGQRIGMNPNFIMATMKMECEFDHTISNPASGATGLVQFMPDTAKSLGTTVAALKKMDALTQLDYVEKYYKSTGVNPSKIKEPAESYLLVFYPAAVGKPDDFVLGSESKKDPAGRIRKIALQNHIYDLNKDGKITKGEVLEYQRKHKFKEVYELMDKGGDTAAPAKDDKSGKGGKETSTKQTTSGNETTSTADQNKQKTDVAKDGKGDKEHTEATQDKYYTHPNASKVNLQKGNNAIALNSTAANLLKSILAKAGQTSGTYTSTFRDAYNQARVMQENYPGKGALLKLYGKNKGGTLEKIRDEVKAKGGGNKEIIAAFQAYVEKLGVGFSRHMSGRAIDIGPSTVNVAAVQKAIQDLISQSGSGVSKLIKVGEMGEKAIHVEFGFKVV